MELELTSLCSQNSYEAHLPIPSLALTIRGPVRGLKRAHSQIATNYSERRLVAREQKASRSTGASKEAGPRRSQVFFRRSLGKSRAACAKAQKPRSVLLEESWAHLPC